jgi:adiponectin receptor
LTWGANVPTIYYEFIRDYELCLAYWATVRGFLWCWTSLKTDIGPDQLVCLWLLPSYLLHELWVFGAEAVARNILCCLWLKLNLYHQPWDHSAWTGNTNARMSLSWMGWMAASNLVGAAIYAARVSGLPCAFAANS